MADQLEEMGYRELQQLCRELGLKASGKAAELVERIKQFQEGGVAAPPSVAAKTPRTVVRRGAAAAAAAAAAATTPRLDTAALLRAAASTPLPPSDAAGADEGHQRSRVSTGGKSAAALRRLRPDSTVGARGKPKRSGGIGAPVFWLLLLTATAAALAAVMSPSCQRVDCTAAVRQQAAALGARAQQAVAAARGQAMEAQEAVRQQWRHILETLRTQLSSMGNGGCSGGGGDEASSATASCAYRAAQPFRQLLPEGEDWLGLHAAASQGLSMPGREDMSKAAAALLVCEVAEDCVAAAPTLAAGVGGAAAVERCVLWLEGGALGSDRGALQRQLADFLRAEPTGTVLLQRFDQMSPELLPVLVNALSEGGAFEMDGETVPTSGATFLLISLMPGDVFDHVRDDVKFKTDAKAHMIVDLVERAHDKEAASSQAKALRRRVDFVLPIGSDPDWDVLPAAPAPPLD